VTRAARLPFGYPVTAVTGGSGVNPECDGNGGRPRVLIPFDRREAMIVQAAGKVAGRTPETIRSWCERHSIGRKVGGSWAVSRPALAMLLDDDRASPTSQAIVRAPSWSATSGASA
jgi:hypothetical protein